MHKAGYGFTNRYRITGTLKCESPLHVGDGDARGFVERAVECGKEVSPEVKAAEPEYATTTTGEGDQPIIPGSSIKGVLRHWLENLKIEAETIGKVFGTIQGGGKAVFRDARRTGGPELERGSLWWDAKRGTCLVPQVVIEPVTRTASEGLLYYTEYVPAESTFRLEVEGQDWSDLERDLVLFALGNGFRTGLGGACVGAGQAGGWGKLRWSLEDIAVIEPADVERWMAGPVKHFRSAYRSVTDGARISDAAAGRWKAGAVEDSITLDVTVQFEGGFLVNDPSQTRSGDKGQNVDPISHASLKSAAGDYYLPHSTIRGALRSQARRIWQTCCGAGADLGKMPPESLEVRRKSELKTSPPLVRLFGASGWRSPIQVEDFELVGKGRKHEQEFVSIDRFTGGSADERKFNAHGLYRPAFRGKIRIDMRALLQTAAAGKWVWLWLAFLMRDWMEGDITMGFGGAKGYGACRAEISVAGNSPEAVALQGIVSREAVALSNPVLEEWEREWKRALEAA